jgi:cell division protein FtsB
MKHSRALGFMRMIGRLSTAPGILAVAILVGIQFARVIQDNVAMSSQLASVQSDIRSLRAQRLAQIREVRRLGDPRGAIPEIHDRLRLVRPNEALIFIRPAQGVSPHS